MGKTWLQDLIIDEARELVEDISATKGKPVNPANYLTPSVANVICAISYGQRFSHKDEKFRRLTTLIGQNVAANSKISILQFFPFLQYIPFINIRYYLGIIKQNKQDILEFLRVLITEHKLNLDGEPRDYIHAFLNETNRQKDKLDTTFTGKLDGIYDTSTSNLWNANVKSSGTVVKSS